MTNQITTRVLRTEREIEEVRPLWREWQRHPNADIDFYLMIQRLRSNVVRPHIILVCVNDAPVAMLVGRIEQGRMECNIGYKSLFAPRVRIMSFIHGGMLGNASEEASEALVNSIMQSLKEGDADMARIHFLRADSAVYPAIRKLVGFPCRDRFPMVQEHWRIEMPATMQDLLAGLSSDHRWSLRKKSKKLLADHANVRMECLSRPEDFERIFNDAEQIAKQTYQRGLGAGFIDSAEMRTIVDLEIRNGWHRSFLLYIDDEPAAFWIGNVYEGTFHSSHLGYLAKYDRYSPGTFLMVRAIEELLNAGIREVDFGLGDARYKQRFGNRNWQDMSVQVFAPTLRGVALNTLRTPILGADRMARKILARTDLLARIKKLWRDSRRQVISEKPRLQKEAGAVRTAPEY